MRFCTMTLGCKVNQYETGAIETILCEREHELVTLGEGCDVCILNTCAVTAESVRKSRQAIRRMKKLEPDSMIAVCGCFSELEPEAVEELGADIISGTKNRKEFALHVEKVYQTNHPHTTPQTDNPKTAPPTHPTFEELPPGINTNRTRALLKIQDGCDNHCAYCIIPYARGGSRSLPLKRIAEYAKQLEEQGYKEIIITGIEISSYTTPRPRVPTADAKSGATPNPNTPPLLHAIQTIQTAAPNARLRPGSLDPAIMTDDFIQKLREIPNLCNHFHLSLQSGCDETLGRMGRKYNTNQVKQAITSLRNHFKDCGITADLITGFPGETDAEFNQTLEFIQKANFSDMHIFPFSPRCGTEAAKMPGQVDKKTRKERARIATAIATAMADDFKQTQIGKTTDVLFEKQKEGLSIGHSSNYLKVAVREKIDKNSMRKVLIIGVKNEIIQGEIV